MSGWKRLMVVVMALTLMVAAGCNSSARKASRASRMKTVATRVSVSGSVMELGANEMLNDINRERAARGLPALARDTGGTVFQSINNTIATGVPHPGPYWQPSPLPAFEVTFIAWGSGLTSGMATNGWMNSPSHRDIILSPRAYAAQVGMVCSGGKLYAKAQIAIGEPYNEPLAPTSPLPASTASSSGSRVC
jgi:uncharacterized protein YkwD